MDVTCVTTKNGWIVARDRAFPGIHGYAHSVRGAYEALVTRMIEHAEVNATFHDELIALAAEIQYRLDKAADSPANTGNVV